SKKWLKEARENIETVGADRFKKRLLDWLPHVAKPRPEPFPFQHLPAQATVWLLAEHNAEILKGLVWMCTNLDDAAISRALGDLAEQCLKKIPWHGPRCKKVGN